jgi:hypothetical protein
MQVRETAGAVTNWGMIVRVKATEAVCCGVPESVTLSVSGVAVSGDVGVPLIAPVEVFSVSPAGSVPEVNCQVYGGTPPDTGGAIEHGVFTMQVGSVGGEITSRGSTVIMTVVAALCCGVPESVTLNMNGVAVNADVRVPLIAPVAELRVNPAGSVPEVNCQVYEETPPVAVRVIEHDVVVMQLRETVGAVINWGMIVKVRFAEALCCGVPESVTLNVSGVAVAGDVGVPLTTPSVVFSVNPAGSVPEVNCQVNGGVPPVAATPCE